MVSPKSPPFPQITFIKAQTVTSFSILLSFMSWLVLIAMNYYFLFNYKMSLVLFWTFEKYKKLKKNINIS